MTRRVAANSRSYIERALDVSSRRNILYFVVVDDNDDDSSGYICHAQRRHLSMTYNGRSANFDWSPLPLLSLSLSCHRSSIGRGKQIASDRRDKTTAIRQTSVTRCYAPPSRMCLRISFISGACKARLDVRCEISLLIARARCASVRNCRLLTTNNSGAATINYNQ